MFLFFLSREHSAQFPTQHTLTVQYYYYYYYYYYYRRCHLHRHYRNHHVHLGIVFFLEGVLHMHSMMIMCVT